MREVTPTCGESCCVCVGDGGDDDAAWSDGLSRSGRRNWRSQSPSFAPWSSAGHGDRTEYRASTRVSHPPVGQERLIKLTVIHSLME